MAKVMVERAGVRFVANNDVQLDAFLAEGYKVVKNEPQPNQSEVEIVSDKIVAVATPKRRKKHYL